MQQAVLGAKISTTEDISASKHHICPEKNPEPQSSGLNPPVEGGGDKLCKFKKLILLGM